MEMLEKYQFKIIHGVVGMLCFFSGMIIPLLNAPCGLICVSLYFLMFTMITNYTLTGKFKRDEDDKNPTYYISMFSCFLPTISVGFLFHAPKSRYIIGMICICVIYFYFSYFQLIKSIYKFCYISTIKQKMSFHAGDKVQIHLNDVFEKNYNYKNALVRLKELEMEHVIFEILSFRIDSKENVYYMIQYESEFFLDIPNDIISSWISSK